MRDIPQLAMLAFKENSNVICMLIMLALLTCCDGGADVMVYLKGFYFFLGTLTSTSYWLICYNVTSFLGFTRKNE